VARTWLRIRVDLLGGCDIECDPPPGRVFIVGPSHTFEQFAEAIDAAFARWDLSHLHEFELGDGRKIGYPDDEYAPELVWLDHAQLKVARETKPGDEFTYTFDFGDNWEHRCVVESEKADPTEEYGLVPPAPVPIWGWGWIPDQYGRRSADGGYQGEEA
jgi:Plasmid pRiA4b ORF-3-like protein